MAELNIHRVRFDERGLMPVIVQDSATSEVIGLRYMDNATLLSTLKRGQTFFIEDLFADREAASLRVVDLRVNSNGGSLTVLVARESEDFHQKPVSLLQDIAAAQKSSAPGVSLIDAGSIEFGIAINNLYALIAERKEKRPEGSYTTYLFNSGIDKILKKIAEESGEVIIAAKNRCTVGIGSKLADLFYHILVLMVERDVRLGDVQHELAHRA